MFPEITILGARLSCNTSLSLSQQCTRPGWVCTIGFAFLFSPELVISPGLCFALVSCCLSVPSLSRAAFWFTQHCHACQLSVSNLFNYVLCSTLGPNSPRAMLCSSYPFIHPCQLLDSKLSGVVMHFGPCSQAPISLPLVLGSGSCSMVPSLHFSLHTSLLSHLPTFL